MVNENDKGGAASVRSIARHFGFTSPNGAHCHIRALSRKGLVTLPGDGSCVRLTRTAINLYSKRPFVKPAREV